MLPFLHQLTAYKQNRTSAFHPYTLRCVDVPGLYLQLQAEWKWQRDPRIPNEDTREEPENNIYIE
jgi:hypothetical protein